MATVAMIAITLFYNTIGDRTYRIEIRVIKVAKALQSGAICTLLIHRARGHTTIIHVNLKGSMHKGTCTSVWYGQLQLSTSKQLQTYQSASCRIFTSKLSSPLASYNLSAASYTLHQQSATLHHLRHVWRYLIGSSISRAMSKLWFQTLVPWLRCSYITSYVCYVVSWALDGLQLHALSLYTHLAT